MKLLAASDMRLGNTGTAIWMATSMLLSEAPAAEKGALQNMHIHSETLHHGSCRDSTLNKAQRPLQITTQQDITLFLYMSSCTGMTQLYGAY